MTIEHCEGDCGDAASEMTNCGRVEQEGNCGDDQTEQCVGNCDMKSREICDRDERQERIKVTKQTSGEWSTCYQEAATATTRYKADGDWNLGRKRKWKNKEKIFTNTKI